TASKNSSLGGRLCSWVARSTPVNSKSQSVLVFCHLEVAIFQPISQFESNRLMSVFSSFVIPCTAADLIWQAALSPCIHTTSQFWMINYNWWLRKANK